jgi:hypothetical protein
MGRVLVIGAALLLTAAAPPRAELVARMIRLSHLPPRSIVSVRPQVGVALLQRGVRGADGVVSGVELQSEVMDDQTAQAYGWRSMRWRLDVACLDRSTRLSQTEAFLDHALVGPPHAGPMPEGWVKPTPGAFMGDVITALCGPARPGKPAPVPGPVLARIPSPPTSPMPATIAPPPSAVVAAPAGSFTVQIGAFLSASEADSALEAVSASAAGRTPPLATRVQPARVHGRLYHRALIDGFSDANNAEAFCASVRAAGGACFVRGR